MKAMRRLCLRGRAYYLSIPIAMAEALGWTVGDPLTIEAIGPTSVRVRPSEVTDMKTAPLPPMNLELPRPAAKS